MQPKLASDEELREYHPFCLRSKIHFRWTHRLVASFPEFGTDARRFRTKHWPRDWRGNINHICGAYKTVLKLYCEVWQEERDSMMSNPKSGNLCTSDMDVLSSVTFVQHTFLVLWRSKLLRATREGLVNVLVHFVRISQKNQAFNDWKGTMRTSPLHIISVGESTNRDKRH